MTEAKTHDVPVFESGQTFRINLSVEDDSGVTLLEARFRNEDEGSVGSVYRKVELGGGTHEMAVIEFQVDRDLSPGHYVCEYVALTDGQGHKSLFSTPGIEFRIEGDIEEHRGPALRDWSFA